MKIIGISDLHLLWEKPVGRLDDAPVTQRNKFEFILRWAQDNCAVILVAGDFFNNPRSWYLLPEIMKILKAYGVEIYACFGQHDTYMYNITTRMTTNLGVLEKAELATILDSEPLYLARSNRQIALYGVSYGQEIPKPTNDKCTNILVIHAPIAEQAIYPGQNYMDAFQFLKEHEFDYIVCGDIHQKFVKYYKGRYIVNSGPLLRKEASIYNFQHKPGFWVIDTDKIEEPEFIEIPHLDAELVLSRAHIDYKEEASNVLDEFIGAVGGIEIDEDISIVENIWRMVSKNKISQDVIDTLADVMSK